MSKYNTPIKPNDDIIISALEATQLYLPFNVLTPCDKYGTDKENYSWLFYKDGELRGYPNNCKIHEIKNVSNYYKVK